MPVHARKTLILKSRNIVCDFCVDALENFKKEENGT